MRVALHTGQLQAPVPGGIGRYVEGLLAHLPEGGPEGGTQVETFAGGRWLYAAWHRFRFPPPRLPAGVDVVHAPSLAVPPPGKRPLVVTVHDLAFLSHPDCFPARGRAFHQRGLELTAREAAAVVVPSAFTGAEVARCSDVPPERIHVVPHGLDPVPEADSADVARRLARLGVGNGARYLLCVGTVEPRKGLDVAVAALQRLRRSADAPGSDVHLVVSGPSGWGTPPDLDRPGVVVTGRVGEADLDALYRGAVALVAASRTEGFGLPVLEAMARGCPVVASAAGSLPEVVGDAGLLVPPGEPEALAAAAAALLAPERRAPLAAAGRARVAAYTWAACVEGHLRAYRAAVGPPPAAAAGPARPGP